jgi:hypothetical protein
MLGVSSPRDASTVRREVALKTVFTKKPDKPKMPDGRTSSRSYDALLDPLPIPEVVESDSDTAWGLWELSMQEPGEEPKEPEYRDTAYDRTEPMDLTVPAPLEKPPEDLL